MKQHFARPPKRSELNEQVALELVRQHAANDLSGLQSPVMIRPFASPAGAHLLIGGAAGTGKTIALHTWAYRLLLQGVRVVYIEAHRADYEQPFQSALATLAAARGYSVQTHSLASCIPERWDPEDALTVYGAASKDGWDTARYVMLLLSQIDKYLKTESNSWGRLPLIVIVDGLEHNLELVASGLEMAMAGWPAQNAYVWLSERSPWQLVRSNVPALRALWTYSAILALIGRQEREFVPWLRAVGCFPSGVLTENRPQAAVCSAGLAEGIVWGTLALDEHESALAMPYGAPEAMQLQQ